MGGLYGTLRLSGLYDLFVDGSGGVTERLCVNPGIRYSFWTKGGGRSKEVGSLRS